MSWICLIGKTTILGMLTRRTQPTSGDALVDGQSVLSSSGPAHAVLGFCPQQDPLMDLLTGREHLALYARLKVGQLAPPCMAPGCSFCSIPCPEGGLVTHDAQLPVQRQLLMTIGAQPKIVSLQTSGPTCLLKVHGHPARPRSTRTQRP